MSTRKRLDTQFYDSTINTSSFSSRKSGKLTDKYIKLGSLGSGAYGTAFVVQNVKTKEKFACKAIPKLKFRKDQLEKFRLEIQLMGRCDHANIIKLYEYYEDDEYFFLIQELCEGGELFDYITGPNFHGRQKEDNGKAGINLEKNAMIIMKQLLSGIAYLHERGIVHRDMKPENILLKEPNDIKNLKIIDFGLSSKWRDQKLMKDQVGTPYYIAPEVLEENYDHKCDIWSLGVIQYILVVGQAPFYGPNDAAIIKKVKAKVYSMSGSQWTYITRECKDLISKMICYPPNRRLNAQQALNHPWFQSESNKLSFDESSPELKIIAKNAGENLANFAGVNKLIHAIKLCISYRCGNEANVKKLTNIFKQIDTNNNGLLDENEFISAYCLFKNISKTSLDRKDKDAAIELFKKMDVNQDGLIEISEWLAVVLDEEFLFSKEKLKEAFSAFDKDGNNTICIKELEFILHDPTVCQSVIKKYGNKNKEIDFENFCKLVMNEDVF